jgi:PIN domain nuclease of toxin-antitoxin system
MVLIDTHVLLWWIGGERRLSAAARHSIETELDGGTIYISSASAWEIAVLASKGRIGLSSDVADWLATVEAIEAVRFVPIDNEIALRSVRLGDDFHRDPGNRFIVATSQKLGVPLVTADDKIRDYPHVATIW